MSNGTVHPRERNLMVLQVLLNPFNPSFSAAPCSLLAFCLALARRFWASTPEDPIEKEKYKARPVAG
jgi:hypothetical protein